MCGTFVWGGGAGVGRVGRRVQPLRQQSLPHLDLLFGPLLPTWLLSQADEGPNSREQIYSVRRTFFGFLYQVLNPDCPCREVVRQVQSLFALLSPRRISQATGAYCQGRGRPPPHSLALLHRLLDQFKPGDLALADRGFSSYTLLALLWKKNVPALFRLHHARDADLRKGKRLGKNDRLVVWKKPKDWERRCYLPLALWNSIAPELPVRILRFSLRRAGYRTRCLTLVTTLLDPQLYPAEQLALLYAKRWQIELWFRDIKTSMGMEVLRCQTPKMIHKELEMFFIAYNLIRCLMIQASQEYKVEVQRLSFKGTVDGVHPFSVAIAQARSRKKQKELIDKLLQTIAADLVPERPGRREPRAVKRRPKPCAWLTKPRHKFKDAQHRNRYWQNKPKKTRP